MDKLVIKEYIKWLNYEIEKIDFKDKLLIDLNSEEMKDFSEKIKKIRLLRKLKEHLKNNRFLCLENDIKEIDLEEIINNILSKEEIDKCDELINNNINLNKLIDNYDNLNIIDSYIVYKLRKSDKKRYK